MDDGKMFRTKTGHCHVLPDRIVLTRSGPLGAAAGVLVGKSIGRILVVHSLLALWLAYLCYSSWKSGSTLPGFLAGALALFFVLDIVRSLKNSATNEIPRRSIQRIVFKAAVPGLTRSFLTVHFTTPEGRARKRLIMLPGSLTGGAAETRKAIRILKEEQLLEAH